MNKTEYNCICGKKIIIYDKENSGDFYRCFSCLGNDNFSKKKILFQLVYYFSINNNLSQSRVWIEIYNKYSIFKKICLRSAAKKAGLKVIDYIEKMGYIDDIIDIIKDMSVKI